MISTLFDGVIPDSGDYAKKIVTWAAKNGNFLRIGVDRFTTHDLSVIITDENGKRVNNPYYGGIYSIYHFKNNNPHKCLYVGTSKTDIHYRLYRFFKELMDMSRDDENHPAAKKARLSGIKETDDLRVMYFSWNEIPKPPEKCYFIKEKLDEYIAFLLKSEYNTNVSRF